MLWWVNFWVKSKKTIWEQVSRQYIQLLGCVLRVDLSTVTNEKSQAVAISFFFFFFFFWCFLFLLVHQSKETYIQANGSVNRKCIDRDGLKNGLFLSYATIIEMKQCGGQAVSNPGCLISWSLRAFEQLLNQITRLSICTTFIMECIMIIQVYLVDVIILFLVYFFYSRESVVFENIWILWIY